MEAKDLRIGNYVTIDNKKYHPKMKDVPMIITSISRNYVLNEGYLMYCDLDKLFPGKYEWQNFSQLLEYLKPIPLTEDWLVRFGFEEVQEFIKKGNGADWQPEYPKTIFKGFKIEINEDHYFVYFESNMQWLSKGNFKLNEDLSYGIILGSFYDQYECSDIVNCKIPEYIHQLQNLYFVLTGKELTLKA